jgi:hypothetical protein
MKERTKFFFLVTLAVALGHFLIVLLLSLVAFSGRSSPLLSLIIPILWLLEAPMNLLNWTSTLPPMLSQVPFIANSLIWGCAVGAISLWRRVRYE